MRTALSVLGVVFLLGISTLWLSDGRNAAMAAPSNVPAEYLATRTGSGAEQWVAEKDTDGADVLVQRGRATFPLLLRKDAKVLDGFVEAKFKALSGSEDRAGGIVWRATDANNYYIARCNALEDNCVLYKVVKGSRIAIVVVDLKGVKHSYGVKAPVPPNVWHTLRADFAGTRFRVTFDGTKIFEADDATFAAAGMTGLWTKADSVTAFKDFAYGTK